MSRKPYPTTAEEWAEEAARHEFCVECQQRHEDQRSVTLPSNPLYFRFENCGGCRRAHITHCLRAYARQVGESWKAQALALTEFVYPCQRSETPGTCPHCKEEKNEMPSPPLGKTGWLYCLIDAIRALPVEAP